MRVSSSLKYAGHMARCRLRGRPALVMAGILPTFRCNLRCTYCNLPGLKTPELCTDLWKSVIDQLSDLGCRRVSFLGGEPLLCTDLPELVDRVRRRGMSCVLTSNGLLVPERVQWLRQVSTLVLSLDSAGPANDEVRGEGSFEAIKKSIESARRNGIPVKINAVLSSRTSSGLDDLLGFIEKHDLHVTLNVMRSRRPELWGKAASIKDDDGNIRKLLVRIAGLARRNRRILFSEKTYRFASKWSPYSIDRYSRDELSPRHPLSQMGPRCQAGRYYMTILPDGSVTACMNTIGQIRGGNVVQDGAASAWRSLHDHGCVTCYSPCLVELNYLFSLNPSVVLNFVSRHFSLFA